MQRALLQNDASWWEWCHILWVICIL